MRALCFLILLLAAVQARPEEPSSPAKASAQQVSALLANWNSTIAAGYESLSAETQELQDSAQAFCKEPSPDRLQQVRVQWRDALSAWQRVQFVGFGPVEQRSRAWQLQFWPDAKNLVARKVQYLRELPKPATAEDIEKVGVAAQGFPALEYLLFDPAVIAESPVQTLAKPETCALLTAVATHLAGVASALRGEWEGEQGFGRRYETGTSPFASPEDALHRTLKAIMSHLEIIKDRKLAAPMGLRGNGRVNGFLAEAWRSGTSVENIRANLHGVEALLEPEQGVGLADHLVDAGFPELAAVLKQRLQSAQEEARATKDNLKAGLESEAGMKQLQKLYIDVELLHQVLADRIAPALGVFVGFNSNDGD